MEYDKVSVPGAPESKAYAHDSQQVGGKDGRLRVKGPQVNTARLKETITFPFSGRTAKNRFLKAPMTERLCRWNHGGEDISARGYPTPEYELLYKRWGKGDIGVIVSGDMMLKYDASRHLAIQSCLTTTMGESQPSQRCVIKNVLNEYQQSMTRTKT